MDWMSPSWLARERSWGKKGDKGREIKGGRDHGYNGAEEWVREESVDRRKEERGRGKEGEKEGEGE